MNSLEHELSNRLAAVKSQGLLRRLATVDSAQAPRILLDGRELINFSSNDYLGLAAHPRLKEAAVAAVERYGAGAGASRLICGNLKVYQDLEEQLACFKQTAAALSFSTGYAAALGTICALAGPADVLILDKLVHASIVDAARLSKAVLRVFRHNDLAHLEHHLKWARGYVESKGSADSHKPQLIVITESVFSMEGDQAQLRPIVELKERYGAWLMVDEAHATGLYGPNRRGLAEQQGVAGQVEIQMGTLGKAAGASGGYICGSRALVDYLVNKARSFIFSTAPVPAAAAAAQAGIALIASDEGEKRRKSLWRLASKAAVKTAAPPASAIIPIHLGPEEKAVQCAEAMLRKGIFIPAIRYPTVPKGKARLRMTLTAAHTEQDVEFLQQQLAPFLAPAVKESDGPRAMAGSPPASRSGLE
ncbi:MAG TPA: 8-amino-7-oxononanoate synthase [Verrucomicrobiae bacterium]|nr:8-amino-7-oxononanoate synthase [Verrucomicrobiae bacterium]